MNIKEAAEYLGISVKTLERKIAAGDVSVAYVPGATGKQRTFDRAELDRFKVAESEKAVATTYVISKSRNFDAPSPSQALQLAGSEQSIQALGQAIADALRATQDGWNDTPHVEVKDKLTLSLIEASQLSGLSRGHLRQAIDEKKLKARIIGKGWRVKRDDLDSYVKKL